MLDSLIPRRTTMLTLIGPRPASAAAAIPSRTLATGKSIPFIWPKTASSSESRLTVTRRSPAAASGPARARSADPLVVRVRSSSPPSGRRIAASIAMRSGRSRRTSGSPPVIRSFSTPLATNDPGDPLDLLEGQDLVARQERVVAPEDLLGHAVRAPEIAPVGDRDAQVAHGPPEPIGRVSQARDSRCAVPRPAVHRRPRGARCPSGSSGPRAVPPPNTAGTSGQLHRTHPCCHSATRPPRPSPVPDQPQRIDTHGADRNQAGLPASVDTGPNDPEQAVDECRAQRNTSPQETETPETD